MSRFLCEDTTSINDKVPRACCAAIPVYSKGNFEEVYAASIQRSLMIVANQSSQMQGNESDVEVHSPATEVEV